MSEPQNSACVCFLLYITRFTTVFISEKSQVTTFLWLYKVEWNLFCVSTKNLICKMIAAKIFFFLKAFSNHFGGEKYLFFLAIKVEKGKLQVWLTGL